MMVLGLIVSESGALLTVMMVLVTIVSEESEAHSDRFDTDQSVANLLKHIK
jgi:hypothetical protein